MHPLIERLIRSENTTIPMIVDENSALEAISMFSGMQISSLDECISGNIP